MPHIETGSEPKMRQQMFEMIVCEGGIGLNPSPSREKGIVLAPFGCSQHNGSMSFTKKNHLRSLDELGCGFVISAKRLETAGVLTKRATGVVEYE